MSPWEMLQSLYYFLYMGHPGHGIAICPCLMTPDLQANYHMVSVDRIGFDKSNSGIAVTSIDEHVSYLEKIVEEYNTEVKKYTYSGHLMVLLLQRHLP